MTGDLIALHQELGGAVGGMDAIRDLEEFGQSGSRRPGRRELALPAEGRRANKLRNHVEFGQLLGFV